MASPRSRAENGFRKTKRSRHDLDLVTLFNVKDDLFIAPIAMTSSIYLLPLYCGFTNAQVLSANLLVQPYLSYSRFLADHEKPEVKTLTLLRCVVLVVNVWRKLKIVLIQLYIVVAA